MEGNGLGKRINMVRKDRGLTAEKLSEKCSINATYLRQIEGGMKMPSLPVFVSICNALRVSPDYLLREELADNEVSQIRELNQLWENASPGQQEIAAAMIRAVLTWKESYKQTGTHGRNRETDKKDLKFPD